MYPNKKVKFLALSIIAVTFLLLLLGGVVHNTESSLACPDWPLCYGQVFPKMEGGILIEHSHRLLASLVGFLTIFLVVFSRKNRNDGTLEKRVYQFSWIALGMVILQGILGGITVIYKLPTAVSTSHLGLSMIYFSTIVYIHHLSSLKNDCWQSLSKEQVDDYFKNWSPILKHLIYFSMALVYIQILLGAFMRHTGAGASCGLGSSNAIFCLDESTWKTVLWPESLAAMLHMSHRIYAVIVGVVVCLVSIISFLKLKALKNNLISFFTLIPIPLVLIQIILGVLTVAKNISVAPTTAHLGGAALLLVAIWKCYLMVGQLELNYFKEKKSSLASDIFELFKPKLSLLVMVTVLVGMLIAPYEISFFKAVLALFLIAMVAGASCAINCYLERDVDALMDRTKNRSLPAGRLDPKIAKYVGISMFAIAIPLLAIYINVLTSALAAFAALVYLFVYTPMKLKSDLAVFVGAIPGAIPSILGWTTVTNSFDLMGFGLFVILFVWQLPHFIAISIYLAGEYNAANIKVVSNTHGIKIAKMEIVFLTFILLLAAMWPAYMGASYNYKVSALVLSVLFICHSLWGFRLHDCEKEKKWAKSYFWSSIVYLPLLLGSMIYFK